jgi:hypothetical protein
MATYNPTSKFYSYYNKDVYDKFIDLYFSVDLKVQSVFIKLIENFVNHDVYTHLLKTMEKDNAYFIMGYLRSQRSIELYSILDKIIRSPLPTKADYYSLFFSE